MFRPKERHDKGISLLVLGLAIWNLGLMAYLILTQPSDRAYFELEESQPHAKVAEKPVEEPREELAQEPTQASEIVGSTGSNKYHQSSCHHARNIEEENIINFNSREDAAKQGYEPCGVCIKN